MPRYEYQGAAPFSDNRNDRVIEPGDVVELDAHVAGPHPDMVPVADADSASGDAESDAGEESDATPPFKTEDLTVSELRGAVQDIDDPDVLEAVREAEASGKNRDTALDAIDAQLE